MTLKPIISILLFLAGTTLLAQSINTPFGKNRVQYHDDFDTWYKYETENFITFYYGKSKPVAKIAMKMAEQDHDEIQSIMEHKINDKIRILVYTDVSDAKQSNIGLDDTFTSRPGETKIIGNKMFVYYDGNQQNLRRQIREGIASVYLSAMQFGDNFQEIVQNAVLLNLPEWYKRGIISYVGSSWNTKVDDELRDILAQNDKYYNFRKLASQYPDIAGHSLWYFIDQYYGKSTISNLLYLTRMSRKINNAFLYIIGDNIEEVQQEWENFYRNHYGQEPDSWNEAMSRELKLKKKSYVPVSDIKYSPDGNYIAYITNNIGKTKIKIKDLKTGKETTVFKYGHKNSLQAADYNYPLMAWSPNGNEITIIYEHRDRIKLRRYNVKTKEKMQQVIPEALRRIYSVDYVEAERYLFSGIAGGNSDLFTYNFVGRQYQEITKDIFDDLDASVATIAGKKGILFSSNRTVNHIFPISTDTIIPDGNFNLFFYDLESNDGSLLRLTSTADINERYPISVSNEKVVFLADKSGIVNRHVYDLKSNQTWATSDLTRNIIRHDAVANTNQHIYTLYDDGKYKMFVDTVDWDQQVSMYQTTCFKRKSDEKNGVFIPFQSDEGKDHNLEMLTEGKKFQSEFGDPENMKPILESPKNDNPKKRIKIIGKTDENKIEKKPLVNFVSSNAKVARLAFRLDRLTSKLDNELLFEGLESYTGNSQELLSNPMGMLFKADVSDLFEDHNFSFGARYPLTFDGSEYFLTYENRKKLWDKKYALYRKVKTETIDVNTFPIAKAKKSSLLGLVQFKYPFTVYKSLRLTGALRLDRYYELISDQHSLNTPTTNEKRLSIKAEYVYDNSIDIALNIKHGTRYKIYSEAINEFNLQLTDGFDFSVSDGFTGIVGFDARHYIPLLEHSVIALRGAGAKSFGNKKNLYYLGGVNNSIVNPFNQEIPTAVNESFAYKTNVFQLRGFESNIRNGSSYALLNTEVRIPIFRYLMGRFDGSSFLRNFQLVGFFDAGAAWYGASPYSDANPLNTETVSAGDLVHVEIKYFRDPLVMGFGGGVRFKLFGYLLRFDLAKGVETRKVQDLKLHFSVGTDF